MKGKRGAAADKRHTIAELEQRAADAEHRADKAEKELAAYREKTDRQIEGLRAELAQARRQRDDGVGPALAEAEEQIRALMVQRDEALQDVKLFKETQGYLQRRASQLLVSLGFTQLEAGEIVMGLFVKDPAEHRNQVTVDARTKRLGAEGAMAIERARGQRGPKDPLGPLADRAEMATVSWANMRVVPLADVLDRQSEEAAK